LPEPLPGARDVRLLRLEELVGGGEVGRDLEEDADDAVPRRRFPVWQLRGEEVLLPLLLHVLAEELPARLRTQALRGGDLGRLLGRRLRPIGLPGERGLLRLIGLLRAGAVLI